MIKSLPRILISVFFVGLLYYIVKDDLPAILESLKNVKIKYLAVAVLMFSMGISVNARRLQLMYQVQEMSMTYVQSLVISYIGYFFNNFLPTAVGGDIVKAYCGARITGHKLKSFTCVLMDRIFGLMMFVLIPASTIFFLIDKLDPAIPMTILIVFIAACLVAVFIFNRRLARKFSFIVLLLNKIRLGEKLVAVYDGLHSFKNHKKMILLTFALSFVAQMLMIVSVHFILLSMGLSMNILYILLLTPVVNLMSMLPSINGLGVRETAFVYFFKSSIGSSNASALAILYLFILCFQSVLGAIVYLVRHDLHFRLKEIPSEVG